MSSQPGNLEAKHSPLTINKSLIIALALITVLVSSAVFIYLWYIATPFEHVRAQNPFEVPSASDARKHLVWSEGIDEKRIAAASGNIVITIGESEDDSSKINVQYGLPKTAGWGVPRMFLKQDEATQRWKLLIAPPKGKSSPLDMRLKGLSSAWAALDHQSSPIEFVDPVYGPCYTINLPETLVEWRELKALPYTDFNKIALGNTAVELAEIHKSDATSLDLQRVLVSERMQWLADQYLSVKRNSVAEYATMLETLKETRGYVPEFVRFMAADKADVRHHIQFRANELTWIGRLNYWTAHAQSPVVEVRFKRAANSVSMSLLARIGTPKETAEEIFLIQKQTAVQVITEWNESKAWPGEQWLLPNDPTSLNPFAFIAILQCLDATYNRTSNDGQLEKQAQLSVAQLFTGLSSEKIQELGRKLDQIEAAHQEGQVGNYHNTYLYCEYLVALVHLKRLGTRVTLTDKDQVRLQGLDDIILRAAHTIGKNVSTAGAFSRYLKGKNPNDHDRSVGQVALYALQYTQLLYSGTDVYKSGLATIEADLKRLAGGFSGKRGGVSYGDGGNPSDDLQPSYFQAQLARLQLGRSVSVEEFRADMKRLATIFSSGGYPLANSSSRDAYRWMYWARVYDLLLQLQTTARDEGFDGDNQQAYNLTAYFTDPETQVSLDKLRDALNSALAPRYVLPQSPDKWTPPLNQAIRGGLPEQPVREIMLMVGMESIRSVFQTHAK